MLSSDRLVNNLRAFCDQTYETNGDKFTGFPASRDQARDKWAGAFDDYISTIEEIIPRPPPPSDTHPSISLGSVKSTFSSTLQLTPIGVAATAAQDFADAWQAAINAITAGGTATDSAGGAWVFTAWTGVPALRAALHATLTALFQAPTTDVVQRLTQIAGAFHTATKGLVANATYTTAAGASTVQMKFT